MLAETGMRAKRVSPGFGKDAGNVAYCVRVLADRSIASDRRSVRTPIQRRHACSGIELGEGAGHLRLEIERLESLAFAAFVARDHQLQDLFGDPGVVAGVRGLGRQ